MLEEECHMRHTYGFGPEYVSDKMVGNFGGKEISCLGEQSTPPTEETTMDHPLTNLFREATVTSPRYYYTVYAQPYKLFEIPVKQVHGSSPHDSPSEAKRKPNKRTKRG